MTETGIGTGIDEEVVVVIETGRESAVETETETVKGKEKEAEVGIEIGKEIVGQGAEIEKDHIPGTGVPGADTDNDTTSVHTF